MKALPKVDLVRLIESNCGDVVFENEIKHIFDELGDDYFRDHGSNKWELTKVNSFRNSLADKVQLSQIH